MPTSEQGIRVEAHLRARLQDHQLLGIAEGHDVEMPLQAPWHRCAERKILGSCQWALSMGGLGLRSATRTRQAASWADSFSMIKQRRPAVKERILVALHNVEGPESTRSAAIVAHQKAGCGRF